MPKSPPATRLVAHFQKVFHVFLTKETKKLFESEQQYGYDDPFCRGTVATSVRYTWPSDQFERCSHIAIVSKS